MYGEMRDAFLNANRVWIDLLPDATGNREAWAGKIIDAQDAGLTIEVQAVMRNGHMTDYVERDTCEIRFLPLQQVKYVTVREES